MFELGALLVLGMTALFLLLAAAAIVKAVLWVVLLPIRLMFWVIGGLILLPLLLLKLLAGVVILLISLPVIVVSIIAAFAALVLGVVLPLVPFVLLCVALWYLLRPQPAATA